MIRAAIACVDSYLAPTDQELQDLDIPTSEWDTMRKCTDRAYLLLPNPSRALKGIPSGR